MNIISVRSSHMHLDTFLKYFKPPYIICYTFRLILYVNNRELINLIIEAASTCEMLVTLCEATHCQIPEESQLNTHRREKLKTLQYSLLHFQYALRHQI